MADGREGDAKTPLGEYHLRFGLYRADRLPRPRSPLTFRPLREEDGWCDAPNDPAYNRFIRLPYQSSHEKLWREDGAYDMILVMSHNCIALAPEAMVKLLPKLESGLSVRII